ncbi:hypothetical protein C7S20_02595 [Christiangramia fulva]|uniref:Secreted protein n=1 Tax=Christiangramia fulva TaxID=2126553 RepID=A0A2R3Z1X3_9FLAO|nr:DUF6520 family protein [Christiangramia fulva]AVR44238.1 hypothetical protein C7S20_02595 [Christiangramia fulva]
MKTKKIFLPVLVLLGTIAMAFNTGNSKVSPIQQPKDFIEVGGVRQPIAEQECQGEGFTCKVKFEEGGTEYPVYDEMNDTQPKQSGSEDATLINP